MSKRPYNPIFLYIIFALMFSRCGPRTDEPVKQPNILFIMTDDHGYQAISAYGHNLIQTPGIDRLATEGVIFRNSFVTNSICGPSRAVMLTGKHSHANGMLNNTTEFDGAQLTFPKLLRQAGYQTAIVGKWHLKSEPTGFDYWNILPGQGQYYNPDFIEMGEKKKVEGYATNVTTDIALNWLENRDLEKPFCLLLHHKAPHRTWQPDTAHLASFLKNEYPVPENFFDQYENREAAAAQKLSIRATDMDIQYDLKMQDPEGRIESRFQWMDHTSRMNEAQREVWKKHYDPITEKFLRENPEGDELYLWKYQRYMQDYLACIRSVDENVGRVLDYLDKNGLEGNTLVVYTSDQGFYLGEHGWFDKRFMYEESFRTPLLMRLPNGYDKRGAINQLVQNIDYSATFLDMAGIQVPREMHGLSMKNLLSGEETPWRDALYYHYYEFPNEHMVKKHYGIRTDRYKLIHFYDDIDVWELYDLEHDPKEMNNLIDLPEYAASVDELKLRLTKLQEEYGDTSVEIKRAID
ncbi:MAG: sulfatase [Cytophagales bacterium]|nr:sulfatase [Cytophagales bacterium]